jgi:hypothetical protein
MQIHELTKRSRTDEGLLDTMRDSIAAVKTGYQQGGIKGAAKASISNTAFNQATNARLQKSTMNDPRIVRGKTLQQVLQSINNDPDTKAGVEKLIPAFQQEFINVKPRQSVQPQQPTATPMVPTTSPKLTPLQQAKALHQRAQASKAATQTTPPGQMPPEVAASPKVQNLGKLFGPPTKGGLADLKNDLEEAVQIPPPGTSVAKPHTGGRVAGQISQTPNAIRQRNARAAKTANVDQQAKAANAFGQMANTLSSPTPTQPATPAAKTTSTGGTVAQTPTGQTHQASATNPNRANPASIEQWAMSKIKGYDSKIKTDPEAAKLIDQSLKVLTQVVNNKNVKDLPTALTNYLLAAKAATMYVSQKNIEKKQASARAKPGAFQDSNDEEEDITGGAGVGSAPSKQRQQFGINKLLSAGVANNTIQSLKSFARTFPYVIDNLFSTDPQAQQVATNKLANQGIDAKQINNIKNTAAESPGLVKDVFATGLSEAEKNLAKEFKTYLKSRG